MEKWILIAYPCPECEVGSVFAVRNKKDGKLCAYCEECDTLWKKPQDVERREYFEPSDEDFEWGGYAAEEEVVNFGWSDYIYAFKNGKRVIRITQKVFDGETRRVDIKIYFDEDDEYSEFTWKNKDYRTGIVVVSRGKQYKVNVYGITRLNQEFDDCIRDGETFYVEPNSIIVKEVTKQNIIQSVVDICTEFDFLSRLKEEKTDLSMYVQVY